MILAHLNYLLLLSSRLLGLSLAGLYTLRLDIRRHGEARNSDWQLGSQT